MIETAILAGIRGMTLLLSRLPHEIAVGIVSSVIRLAYVLRPRYGRITRRNLELAFPESDKAWRERIARQSVQALARVLVDFARLDRLTPEWVKLHVSCALLDRFLQVKRDNPCPGVLLVTGHLGSFELLGHCMPMFGHPISFVVRNFKMKKVDSWWTAKREAYGNRVIGRKGAFHDVVQNLREGRDVAILFDQNVTRNHAVFVDFMGVSAATTKTPALAALRTQCPIFVASMVARGGDRYEIVATELEVKDVYADDSVSRDDKVLELTSRMSRAYEEMIRAHPGEWFWMHRRFRTQPDEKENPYAGC